MNRLGIIFLTAMMLLTWGCSGNRNTSGDSAIEACDTLTTEASLLCMTERPDGVIVAEIKDPWNPGRLLQRLVLVNDDNAGGALPEGTVIKCPVKRSLVSSVMFAHGIDELGATEAIAAVTDGQYYKTPAVRKAIDEGRIVNVGSSMQPNAELIAACRPDVILSNPYQNAGHGVIETMGVPIVEMADYMEPTPLGRAEWIKLLGVLYGNPEKADNIYNSVKENYAMWKNRTGEESPVVLTEMSQDGVWFVPGGESYMARIIADAGASYPWSGNGEGGSLQLDFPTVYNAAHDADYWFIKTDNPRFSYKDLKEAYPLNEKFRPFQQKKVYFLDTAGSMFFEEMSFHPDLLLRDFVIILHPDSAGGEEPRYYHPAL